MPERRPAIRTGRTGPEFRGPETPHSIEVEHEELMEELARLERAPGDPGAAAGSAARTLRPHFEKETVLVLPPLEVRESLDGGRMEADPQEVRALVRDLRLELPKMLREHRRIDRALEQLADVARRTRAVEGLAFAEKLRLHAEMEEEVLYPAALPRGRFLEERARRSRPASRRR